MSEFSTRLKIALNNKGIRASTLAYRTGVDRSTISNYLNGKYKAKSEMVEKLAAVLGVSSAWLDGFDVPMNSPKSSPQLTESEELILDLFRSVPEEHRELVLQMIRAAINTKG